jgi:phosphate transport system substrate-binding protein
VGVGGRGNDGVAAQVKQITGAIGYVEYGYAKQTKMPIASLENKSGKFIEPNKESATKALDTVKLPENLREFIDDPEGEDVYSLVTYTWVMALEKYEDKAKAKTFKEVMNWSLTEGQKLSEELGYVPLPKETVEKVKAAIEKIQG